MNGPNFTKSLSNAKKNGASICKLNTKSYEIALSSKGLVLKTELAMLNYILNNRNFLVSFEKVSY